MNQYDNIYFLGIGGIGMSALARWFMKKGLRVSGYDRTATALTRELEKEGMAVHYDDQVELIPREVIDQPGKSLVIFTGPCYWGFIGLVGLALIRLRLHPTTARAKGEYRVPLYPLTPLVLALSSGAMVVAAIQYAIAQRSSLALWTVGAWWASAQSRRLFPKVRLRRFRCWWRIASRTCA